MQADYVIIGAGSAGCVLANRLSTDPATRVMLIEAGGPDRNPLIHIPAGYIKLLDHPSLTWGFKAEPDPGVNGRAILYPRGRVLGGSSSINGMIYVRGQPEDFDHWAQLGNRGWSWDDVLPYFKRAEDWEDGADDFHGEGGPLLTSRSSDKPPLCQRIIQAGIEIGLEYHDDVNHLPPGAADNIGWVQQTRRGRRRQSAARTYLRPAMKRQNLSVVTGALVHRVVLDGKRAVAVEFSRGGPIERVDAAREIVLSGGAIGSPHILQLSGIGDPEHLGKIGVSVNHALPGVGKNLQDHFLARVTAEVTGIGTANEKSRGMPFVGEVMRYVFAGSGLLTYAASLVCASVKVLEESATPDVQILFANASFAPGPIRRLDDRPGMTGGMWQMRPLSRGYVEAKSADPHMAPAINPRYLSEETDRRAAIGGLRAARRLFHASALAPYFVGEILPGAEVVGDDELLDYARQYGSTVFHATCTCKMGPDAMAVVDDRLRVHGLEGLRVIDASVMPTVTSTNTNAPTIMIAEKGAAMMLDEGRQRLAGIGPAREEKKMQADYVIVGAGSAGCVLANRLTADQATRVVLIEAGGRDWNPLIHIPAGFMKLLDHPSLTWGFKAEADPGTNGRAIPYPRGRVLGGSSSINGLIYIRGQPEDFDYWAQLGNRGWGWDDVLPYFKKAENWQGEASEPHGSGGFLTTSPMSERPAACRAIIEAAQELGLEYRADVNDLPPGAGDSIGWCQQTRGGRRRASAARTYLRPASKRPNLQVVTGALVHRVVFDGTRAVGVEFSRNGGPGSSVERAEAACEVILAAGAVGSPHLLQLSGVGDPEVLAKAGIAVHHPLPGVGKNFQDHYIARMSCEVTGIETLNERGRGLSFAGELLRYVTTGSGMLTYSASLCAASVKVLEESATPDVQCVFAPASYKPGLIRVLDDKPGITGGPWQMRPLSRGYVLVRSPDPREQPAINPRYLAEDTDRRAMVGGLKFLRRLFAVPSLATHIVAETMPGPGVQSDDELLDYARQNGSTVYHASCSCMMGNHAMSVVDDELRVHGLDALRVIDASVMPAVSSTNTNAPTIMIAEKGAAMIKARARERLAA